MLPTLPLIQDYEAPYITLSEIYDINLKYLDTIQKSMTPKVAKSMYGKKLTNFVEKELKKRIIRASVLRIIKNLLKRLDFIEAFFLDQDKRCRK
jgi:hypothetical protein